MSNLLVVLLPCIISGYLLVNTSHFRSWFPEKTGSNVYLRTLAVGAIWTLVFGFFTPDNQSLVQWWKSLWFYSYGIPLEMMPPIMAAGATSLADRLFPADIFKIFRRQTKNLESFIFKAVSNKQLIMITLSNGKVYIGKATEIGGTEHTPEWLIIFPFASGYRCRENMSVNLMTDNIGAFSSDEKTDTHDPDNTPSIVLSVKEIISIGLFEVDLYKKFMGIAK